MEDRPKPLPMYSTGEIIALTFELMAEHPGLDLDTAMTDAILLMRDLDMNPGSRYRPCRVVMFEKEDDHDHRAT